MEKADLPKLVVDFRNSPKAPNTSCAVKFFNYLAQLPPLRMLRLRGATPPFPPYAFMACAWTLGSLNLKFVRFL